MHMSIDKMNKNAGFAKKFHVPLGGAALMVFRRKMEAGADKSESQLAEGKWSYHAPKVYHIYISHRRKPIYNATSAEGAIPEKIYSRAHCINMIGSTLLILKIDISEHYVRTRKTGCRGGSPCKRNDVILRSARRQLCDEGSRADRVVPRSARCHNKVVCCEFP